MSKYIVLYATLIGVDFCEEGDIIELPDGTDRNFIARMQTIGAIAPYEGKNDVAPSNKDAKNDAKENKKATSDKSKEAKKDDKNRPRTTRTPMPKVLTKTINLDMVRNDIKGILNQNFSINLRCIRTDKLIKCHFNTNSRIIYENGAVGTEITALITLEDAKNIRLKDEVKILGDKYEITKSVIESQVLKRLFLREI